MKKDLDLFQVFFIDKSEFVGLHYLYGLAKDKTGFSPSLFS